MNIGGNPNTVRIITKNGTVSSIDSIAHSARTTKGNIKKIKTPAGLHESEEIAGDDISVDDLLKEINSSIFRDYLSRDVQKKLNSYSTEIKSDEYRKLFSISENEIGDYATSINEDEAKLTDNQKEFFKDSKVVDEAGNLQDEKQTRLFAKNMEGS